ncbi:MAG: hypothetical protein RBS39_00885 [Phycisphaerales bacterium]|jgi:hypothetical protein|nr:hypothetical protein [Phycisphaerales bacterium]
MELSPLHERLLSATGGRTYKHLADLTGTHPETVRRYMQGQSMSVEFITGLCQALQLNPQWVLTGHGPMHLDDVKSHALKTADPSELLAAVAATLESLLDRVDRLEVFVQSLEARMRTLSARGTDGLVPTDLGDSHPYGHDHALTIRGERTGGKASDQGQPPIVQTGTRAGTGGDASGSEVGSGAGASGDGGAGAAAHAARARRVGDALPQRPRPTAD